MTASTESDLAPDPMCPDCDHVALHAEYERFEKLLMDADWRELDEKRKVEALAKHNGSLMMNAAARENEIERLRAERDEARQAGRDTAVQLHEQYLELADTLKAVRQDQQRALGQRDELHAEVERLITQNLQLLVEYDQQRKEAERLRVALEEIADAQWQGARSAGHDSP